MYGLQKKKSKKGFTLIELIVVIAILAILALIAIPRLAGFTETANERADLATARTMYSVIAVLVAEGETVDNAAIGTYMEGGFPVPKTGGVFTYTSDPEITVLADGTQIYPE